ncbi:hypothetical protein [Adlercreutzia equolifaciens]|uniref:hypothetical protein n=1 Tax=Adlercreutzia equolifaciens TaxID=446660 RepID=UPI0022E610ED|nr:hypothetical protein [Adlercreutzia equolifaciens]
MGISENQLSADDASIHQIHEQLANAEIHLAVTDIEVDASDSFKLPLDQITALGVGLGSLPTMFRSVTTTISVPTLLQATDKLGNPLDPAVLQRFSDGSGMLGSFRDAATGFGQARFHQVDPGAIQSVATMPYDPTMLFMAAALAQINQKLDAIQDTVNEMFEYMRQKDKAELRGNVKTLEDVLEAYRYNWNNDIWRKNAHMKVVDIKQESEKAIIHLRAQIRAKMGEKGPVELRLAVGGRLDKVLDRLKEYQLATYTYSFAAFLEPMLSENFDEANLNAIAAKISDHGNEYRKLYTECYNAIEESSKASADAVALRGASAAFAGLGAFVKQTPLGERTSVDEALEKVGRGVGSFNEGQTRSLMEKLQHAKTPNVLPFKQSLEAVNNLHNHPHQLAADGENVYLLPFSRMCVVTDS